MSQSTETTDLAYLTATQLNARYAAHDLSPVDVTRRGLARTEQFEPRLNAFVLVDADRALSAARASEERWQRGSALGPLDGVPISINQHAVRCDASRAADRLADRRASPRGPFRAPQL